MRQSFDETTDPSFAAKHLPLLRAKMAEQGLDGLLVPHEDEHQNEYLPEANERLAWISGFTGSAGAGARERLGRVRDSRARPVVDVVYRFDETNCPARPLSTRPAGWRPFSGLTGDSAPPSPGKAKGGTC